MIKVGDGKLEKILKENKKKLVCVLFSNTSCGYCKKVEPLWESLPSQNPTCLFGIMMVDNSPTEAKLYKIDATPIAIFFLNMQEIHRVRGLNNKEILQTIDQYKPQLYQGQAHTLGETSPSSDYYSNLLSGAIKPPNEEPLTQEQFTQVDTTPSEQKSKRPPPDQSVSSLFTRGQLKALGFDEKTISDALTATNNGDVDECVEYITNSQMEQATQTASESNNNNDIKPPPSDQQSPETPPPTIQKPLSEAGMAMRTQLLEFGYDEEYVMKAINTVGPDSIDKLVDCIDKLQKGESIESIASHASQLQMSPEEIERKQNELRSKANSIRAEKEGISPEAQAKKEIHRRKDVLEQIEAKKKFDEAQREQALRDAQKERQREKLERERVKQRIIAQREARKAETEAKTAVTNQNPQPVKSKECIIKFIYPNNFSKQLKFPPETQFQDVDLKIREEDPSIASCEITYSIAFPPCVIAPDDFSLTLNELGLCPRSMVNITYY